MSRERYRKLFESKVALEKTWEHFPQNKAVPSFRKMPRDYVNFGGPGPTQYIFIRPWHDIAYIFVLESAVC